MKTIISDADGYRCTVCGHTLFPKLILDCIVCRNCGVLLKNSPPTEKVIASNVEEAIDSLGRLDARLVELERRLSNWRSHAAES